MNDFKKTENTKIKKSNQKTSYKSAGVDLKAAAKAIEKIKKPVFSTFNKNVLNDLTSYAGLFYFEKDKYKEPVLVSSTDGVGTKLLVAKQTGIYKNIGQDLVAMCINDIICCGATPLFFLDYIACGKLNPNLINKIVTSIAESCKFCETALIGGETAEMPGMYGEDDIDLAGFAVGVVEKKSILNPGLVDNGDIILGLASSGLHSNGYSLVRKIINDKKIKLNKVYKYDDPFLERKTFGQILMEPTRLYFKVIKDLAERGVKISGIAHITGGGFYENINRIIPKNLDAHIYEGTWQKPQIFKFLESKADISHRELFTVFNMGIGMIVLIKSESLDCAMKYSKEYGENIYNIGIIKKGSGKVIINKVK